MKQILGNRVNELRKSLKLKQIEFAERLGLTSAAISAIELGKAPLTEANIRLISLTFGIREEWLRDGTGEMMDDEAQLTERERQLLAFFRELSPSAQGLAIEYAREKVELQELRKKADGEKTLDG